MNAPLKHAANNHAQLRERLKQQFALDDDDQALIDTLEGLSDFNDLCAEAIRAAIIREGLADAMTDIIRRNKARKERHERAAEAIRQAVLDAMQDAGVRKVEAPDLTFSIRDGGRKLIIDEKTVPHDFCEQIITWKPDRDKIKQAVDNGDVPPGVQILNGSPTLTVRQ